MEINQEIKEKILKNLKEQKSTSEIASLIGRNNYDTKKILGAMKSEGLIECTNKGRYVFWSKVK